MSSAEPQFQKIAYMTVPTSFEYVQLTLIDQRKKALAGLRFRGQYQHPGGCLGLRRARSPPEHDGEDGLGQYVRGPDL